MKYYRHVEATNFLALSRFLHWEGPLRGHFVMFCLSIYLSTPLCSWQRKEKLILLCRMKDCLKETNIRKVKRWITLTYYCWCFRCSFQQTKTFVETAIKDGLGNPLQVKSTASQIQRWIDFHTDGWIQSVGDTKELFFFILWRHFPW